MIAGGCVVIVVGVGSVVYYMTFGIYFDEETFVLAAFGKKTKTYQYDQIISQQLFSSYNTLVVELTLADGRTVQLQSSMEGVYTFLDTASAGWLKQNGKTVEECAFYDPENSCWFPTREA